MPHVIERATSGRAKCRGCERPITAGDLRFGERRPNPYADDGGETTHWFHVPCAALTRPEPFLETLSNAPPELDRRDWLEHQARLAATYRRLPRARGVERASSGRASCRSCREPIAKGSLRVALVYYEEGRFTPSGFVHVRCAPAYFETPEVAERLRAFSPDLSAGDLAELTHDLAAGA